MEKEKLPLQTPQRVTNVSKTLLQPQKPRTSEKRKLTGKYIALYTQVNVQNKPRLDLLQRSPICLRGRCRLATV